jgi:acetylglutamate kinase
MYCFEKKGVLSNADDEDSVIPEITEERFKQYVADGTIQGGMIPKIENSLRAVKAGVKQVVITKADDINAGTGTVVK